MECSGPKIIKQKVQKLIGVNYEKVFSWWDNGDITCCIHTYRDDGYTTIGYHQRVYNLQGIEFWGDEPTQENKENE